MSSPRGSKSGSRRRFFGLSEAAEAEAEAAVTMAEERGNCEGQEQGKAERRRCSAKSGLSIASGGDERGREVIDAHRMVVSLRSEPMRAMLRSGERVNLSCVCTLPRKSFVID